MRKSGAFDKRLKCGNQYFFSIFSKNKMMHYDNTSPKNLLFYLHAVIMMYCNTVLFI